MRGELSLANTLFDALIGVTPEQKHFVVIIQQRMHLFAGLFFAIEFLMAHVLASIIASHIIKRQAFGDFFVHVLANIRTFACIV